ncbi:response regulator [Spirosoma flavum]|uniref:Response regulator n=1 Tax=Spirosoma flavum TaxID=2048557 RepID=A0ABW6APV6_9BACT
MSMDEYPILFIDADEDDHTIFKQALAELAIPNPVLVFSNAQTALDYLIATQELPFLIISEISMPGMNGLELRRQIEQDPNLRRKSTPFIFMTHPVVDYLVDEAYELTIQGLFEKKTAFQDWKNQLGAIIAYWNECKHPKRFAR